VKQNLVLLAIAALCFAQPARQWQSRFPVDRSLLGVKGSNLYFNLTPGFQLSYAHGKNTQVVKVLNETRRIDGVETRVVEDREMKNGQLVELTRDYYAIDSATNDVYYFGEDVDVYRNGKVVNHEGAWLSGVNGAAFGLMMPGHPQPGQRFYQESAPGVGMDRAEIQPDTPTLRTPAGSFDKCLHVVETSPLEKGSTHKWYAAGVGAVRDSEMSLVKWGMQ
jgi:hypothetical protein